MPNEEVNVEQLSFDEINPFEGFDQEAPLPQEPSVDELIDQAVREKEEQIQNLTMQLYGIQRENEMLKQTINQQELKFNEVIAGFAILVFSNRGQ